MLSVFGQGYGPSLLRHPISRQCYYMAMENLAFIERFLAARPGSAYLSLDYENKNPLLASFTSGLMLTRKVAFLFKSPKPVVIAQTLDCPFLRKGYVGERFEVLEYRDWKEYLTLLRQSLVGTATVYMDVSENGLLPRVSLADYGSVAYVASLGKEIRSSGDLLNEMIGTLSPEGEASQKIAADLLLAIKDEAFAYISAALRSNRPVDEYEVQSFIARRFEEEGMVYDDPPIVAVNANASNPHYLPSMEKHSPIKKGDLILIDMWAKKKEPGSVYGDITWMAYAGNRLPPEMARPFRTLVRSIDAALAFLTSELPKREVAGYEVDRLVRKIVEEDGYLPYFTHRTGHSIKDDAGPHGPGVNIDDYESHDERKIVDGNSFSLEPGIYLPSFGMRSETDVLIKDRKPLVVAGRQESIVLLLD